LPTPKPKPQTQSRCSTGASKGQNASSVQPPIPLTSLSTLRINTLRMHLGLGLLHGQQPILRIASGTWCILHLLIQRRLGVRWGWRAPDMLAGCMSQRTS
jgi:hypothetical protein